MGLTHGDIARELKYNSNIVSYETYSDRTECIVSDTCRLELMTDGDSVSFTLFENEDSVESDSFTFDDAETAAEDLADYLNRAID